MKAKYDRQSQHEPKIGGLDKIDKDNQEVPPSQNKANQWINKLQHI